MSELDLIAAIDAAADTLTECKKLPFVRALLRSARDEIVALRGMHSGLAQAAQLAEMRRQWRALALEEAARVCEALTGAAWDDATAEKCAAAIRALVEKS